CARRSLRVHAERRADGAGETPERHSGELLGLPGADEPAMDRLQPAGQRSQPAGGEWVLLGQAGVPAVLLCLQPPQQGAGPSPLPEAGQSGVPAQRVQGPDGGPPLLLPQPALQADRRFVGCLGQHPPSLPHLLSLAAAAPRGGRGAHQAGTAGARHLRGARPLQRLRERQGVLSRAHECVRHHSGQPAVVGRCHWAGRVLERRAHHWAGGRPDGGATRRKSHGLKFGGWEGVWRGGG
ncbi:hypothetical protein AV274_1782, partial [Blastocystis sp. ATCC 50177/Nand II]